MCVRQSPPRLRGGASCCCSLEGRSVFAALYSVNAAVGGVLWYSGCHAASFVAIVRRQLSELKSRCALATRTSTAGALELMRTRTSRSTRCILSTALCILSVILITIEPIWQPVAAKRSPSRHEKLIH